jgi:hypothetical protein
MASTGEARARLAVEVKDQDANIVLNPAPSEIRGSIKQKPDGQPADLHALSVEILPEWLERESSHAATGPLQVDTDGKFRQHIVDSYFTSFALKLSDLPPRCYRESIHYGGNEVSDSGIEYLDGATLEITIACDGGKVDGKVLDADDNPLGGALVALIPMNEKSAIRTQQSGPGGAFHLVSIPPGDYILLAWNGVGPDDLENPEFIKRFEN